MITVKRKRDRLFRLAETVLDNGSYRISPMRELGQSLRTATYACQVRDDPQSLGSALQQTSQDLSSREAPHRDTCRYLSGSNSIPERPAYTTSASCSI